MKLYFDKKSKDPTYFIQHGFSADSRLRRSSKT